MTILSITLSSALFDFLFGFLRRTPPFGEWGSADAVRWTKLRGQFLARQPLGTPAASAFTSLVVRGLPPIPQSPLLTSSITTHVTGRMFSPSIDTIASVSLRIIYCFCIGVNTPSISFTFTKGIAFSNLSFELLQGFSAHRNSQVRASSSILSQTSNVTRHKKCLIIWNRMSHNLDGK